MTDPGDKAEQNRRDALAYEDEAWHAEQDYQQEQLAQEEVDKRQSAVEEMAGWFLGNFEDPQNEMPYDSEDGEYLYPYGGPFDANDMIHGQFNSDYNQSWIDEAVEQVQSSGIFEWAPSINGEFYDTPDDEGNEAVTEIEFIDLKASIEDRLGQLEQQLATLRQLPAPIGHNQPQHANLLPPFTEETWLRLERAISATRSELSAEQPNGANLRKAQVFFRQFSVMTLKWLGKKVDLAIDEGIKAGVKAGAWGTAATLAFGLGDDLGRFLRHLI